MQLCANWRYGNRVWHMQTAYWVALQYLERWVQVIYWPTFKFGVLGIQVMYSILIAGL